MLADQPVTCSHQVRQLENPRKVHEGPCWGRGPNTRLKDGRHRPTSAPAGGTGCADGSWLQRLRARARCSTGSLRYDGGSGIPCSSAAVVWLRTASGSSCRYGRARAARSPGTSPGPSPSAARGTRIPRLGIRRSDARSRPTVSPNCSASAARNGSANDGGSGLGERIPHFYRPPALKPALSTGANKVPAPRHRL